MVRDAIVLIVVVVVVRRLVVVGFRKFNIVLQARAAHSSGCLCVCCVRGIKEVLQAHKDVDSRKLPKGYIDPVNRGKPSCNQ
jgi:hypothetical protein